MKDEECVYNPSKVRYYPKENYYYHDNQVKNNKYIPFGDD